MPLFVFSQTITSQIFCAILFGIQEQFAPVSQSALHLNISSFLSLRMINGVIG